MVYAVQLSFPRKRESILLCFFWTPAPACAGVTTLGGSEKHQIVTFILLEPCYLENAITVISSEPKGESRNLF